MMKWPYMVTQMGFEGLAVAVLLTLLAGFAGHLLPPGETYAFTLPDGVNQGAYLMDVLHRVVYQLSRQAVNPYAINPQNADEMAYTLQTSSSNWDVFITNIFASSTRQLTDSPGYDAQPVWSPDGRWIVFVSDRGGSFNLYVVEAGGGTPQQLTHSSFPATNPAWSPDGRWIVYQRGDTMGQARLYVLNTACPNGVGICQGETAMLTYSTRNDYLAAWSPDGEQIAFVSDRGGWPSLYILDSGCLDEDGGCVEQNPRPLTEQQFFRVDDVQWSKDGHRVRLVAYGSSLMVYGLDTGCGLLPDPCPFQPFVVMKR